MCSVEKQVSKEHRCWCAAVRKCRCSLVLSTDRDGDIPVEHSIPNSQDLILKIYFLIKTQWLFVFWPVVTFYNGPHLRKREG